MLCPDFLVLSCSDIMEGSVSCLHSARFFLHFSITSGRLHLVLSIYVHILLQPLPRSLLQSALMAVLNGLQPGCRSIYICPRRKANKATSFSSQLVDSLREQCGVSHTITGTYTKPRTTRKYFTLYSEI